MSATRSIAVDLSLEVIDCATCAVNFAAPATLLRDRRKTHANFWCPNGHANHYPGETEQERAIRELRTAVEIERRRADAAEQNEALERAARQSISKRMSALETRVSAGVCPCCNRTFQQLARHMKAKHPDFAESQTRKNRGRKHG